MIPFFEYNAFVFGPITIQVWGVFVSLGILAAVFLSMRLAKKYFLSDQLMLDIALWALMGGLLGARIFHVLFYALDYYQQYPGEIFKFWHGGASSLGGFAGAGLAVFMFAKLRRFKLVDFAPYLDISVLSLWLGWAIGRLGCFFIHDHPGRLSHFFLAVNFPGGARHDLGLYESILALGIFVVYFLLFKKLIKIQWGLVAMLSFMDYALARFLLDFLRATDLPWSDARYLYLTPAQWGMIGVFSALTFLLIWIKIKRHKNIGRIA